MSHYDDDNIDNKPESNDEIRGERSDDTAGTASDTQPSEDEEAMNEDEDQEDISGGITVSPERFRPYTPADEVVKYHLRGM